MPRIQKLLIGSLEFDNLSGLSRNGWLSCRSETHLRFKFGRQSPVEFRRLRRHMVNKASLGKYAGLISGNWKLGKPLDLYLRGSVQTGLLKAFLTVPFLTSIAQTAADSDIRGSLDRSRRVCDTFRRALFPAADLSALHNEMQGLTAGAQVSPLTAVYLNTEMFMLSDKFVPF